MAKSACRFNLALLVHRLSALAIVWVSAFTFVILAFAGSAQAKTDVRALVAHPKETTKLKERGCKQDSDCVAIQCHTPCGFDGAANSKFIAAIASRCSAERKADGSDTLKVDCAPSTLIQTPKCKKKRCVLVETLKDHKSDAPDDINEGED